MLHNSSSIYPRGTTAVAYIPGGQQQWHISTGDNSSGIYPRGTTAVAYISEYLLIIFHLPYLLVVADWWFSLGTLVSSTNKTDRHVITEILLKVALSTINPKPKSRKIPLDNTLRRSRYYTDLNPSFRFTSTCVDTASRHL
jgi:hypothetical protein